MRYGQNFKLLWSESRYVMSASRYQSRSAMYIRGLIPRNWPRKFRSEPEILVSSDL